MYIYARFQQFGVRLVYHCGHACLFNDFCHHSNFLLPLYRLCRIVKYLKDLDNRYVNLLFLPTEVRPTDRVIWYLRESALYRQ